MSKSNKGQQNRKRPAKQPEDFFWDCSVCTYKNNPEAFKCVMCDVRKGTSTRKSRINPDSVAVQVQHALLPPPLPPKFMAGMREAEEMDEEDEEDMDDQHEQSTSMEMPPPASLAEDHPSPSTSGASGPAPKGSQKKGAKPKPPKPVSNRSKFTNVDRKNAQSMEITVDNVTVMVTEYKMKQEKKKKKKDKKDSHSSNSSLVGEPPSHMNDDSLDKPSTSSKQGSGAESESEVRSGGARGGSEELETTRSS